jgi:hypothetical protein
MPSSCHPCFARPFSPSSPAMLLPVSTPRVVAHGSGLRCCGGGHYRPRRTLSVVVVPLGLLGCPCPHWCPIVVVVAPLVVVVIAVQSLSSFCPLLVVPVLVVATTPQAAARGGGTPSSAATAASRRPVLPLLSFFGWFLSLSSLSPIVHSQSTLRAVARSGSGRCWIPQEFTCFEVVVTWQGYRRSGCLHCGYTVTRYSWHPPVVMLDPNKPLTSH